ncbi:MAG: DNA primase [Burkholderiaceae bacterium]
MIPPSFIDDLLQRVDVADVVGQYVSLKKSGANYSGLCPFHTEKSPSFTVSPTKQFYHCFGCGAHGTAVGFLMEHLGLSFPQAVEELANRVGLQVPQEVNSANAQADSSDRQAKSDLKSRLHSHLLEAARYYQRRLKDSPQAIDYLKGRGISGETAKRFHIGYAPAGWQGLQSVFSDYSSPELEQAGLVIAGQGESAEGQVVEAKRYDRFRNRIMFPILSPRGEVIGFGARAMGDEQPKYLNSPETPVFSKGSGLYGLYEARAAIRDAGEVWVVEGYMDVVMLSQFGLGQAVATLGTATTEEHLRLLSRQSGRLVFMFDGDTAGRKAAARALETSLAFASEKFQIRFAFLPQGHDPDSLVRQKGKEAVEEAARSATALSEFVLQHAADDQDLRLAEGRAAAAAQVRRLFALMPNSELKRQILLQACQRFQVDPSSLGVASARSNQTSLRPKPRQGRPASGGAIAGLPASKTLSLGDRLLQFLVRCPAWLDDIAQHPDARRILGALSEAQQAVYSFIQDNRSRAGFAGLFEAAAQQSDSLAMQLFKSLARPDPGIDDLLEDSASEEARREFERLQNRLLLAALQRESDELTAVANPDALQKLRQLHQRMVDLKQSLIQ